MNTQIRSTDMALPPPPVTEDLMDRERTVGWISDGAFGFHGFANESEAAGAAWVAYRAVARALARRAGERPIPIDVEPLALAMLGDREVILASNREIATLVRPGTDGRTNIDSLGFELELPSPVDELTLRSLAYVAYRTLRRSGVRWAMWMLEPAHARPVRRAKSRPAPSARFAATWLALAAGSGMLLALALLMSGALRPVLAAAGLAGLVIVRLVAIHGQWAPRGAAWVASKAPPPDDHSASALTRAVASSSSPPSRRVAGRVGAWNRQPAPIGRPRTTH